MCYEDWLDVFAAGGGAIYNEYGERVELGEFLEKVAVAQERGQCVDAIGQLHPDHQRDMWIDPLGYWMDRGEFS